MKFLMVSLLVVAAAACVLAQDPPTPKQGSDAISDVQAKPPGPPKDASNKDAVATGDKPKVKTVKDKKEEKKDKKTAQIKRKTVKKVSKKKGKEVQGKDGESKTPRTTTTTAAPQ